jgi:hypothetical protein
MYQDYNTPATSPPTPLMSSGDVMRTRSGYGIPRIHQNLKPMPEGRSNSDKSPAPKKKAKKEKTKADKKIAKLEKPLSELTKDWTHVPVADIEAYVNRSVEERRREVDEGKVPGKVKRPMNSFMLYRKAYQNRTKDWCLQNNHQVVSQVCGDSWPLEPDEVKDQFNEWAKTERQNHQNAHPGYKFSPTKPSTTKIAKRKMSEDIDTEESDLDDFEWQGSSSKRSRRQPRSSSRAPQPVAYPTTRSAYRYSRDGSVESTSYNKSSFQLSNPGRPIPQQYNQAGLAPSEYYQHITHNNPTIPGVQDILVRKAVHSSPGPGAHSFLGLPGGGHEYDIMHQYPGQYDGGPGGEYRIDPSLIINEQPVYNGLVYSDSHPEGVYFGANHGVEGPWQQPSYSIMEHQRNEVVMNSFLDPELDNGQIENHHAHVLRGNQENWHAESLDTGEGVFDKWMDEQ